MPPLASEDALARYRTELTLSPPQTLYLLVLDLGIPSLQTRSNKFLLFIDYSLHSILVIKGRMDLIQ